MTPALVMFCIASSAPVNSGSWWGFAGRGPRVSIALSVSDREEQVSKDESLHFSLAGFLIPATGSDTTGKEKEMMEKRKRERERERERF